MPSCPATVLAVALATVAVAGGCATQLADPLRQYPAEAVAVSTLQVSPEEYAGKPLLIGGVVASVENRSEGTWLAIVARPLDREGRPVENWESDGRILAQIPGFLDPTVYAPGRSVTVVGILEGSESRPIGDYQYVFPVLAVQTHVLWKPLPPPLPVMWPGYYDPWDCPFSYRGWNRCW